MNKTPSINIRSVAVIGDGGWGTTLAIHLAKKKYPVTLWGPFPEHIRILEKNRYNAKFLPGIRFPASLKLTDSMEHALNDHDLIVFAVPSKFARDVLRSMKKIKFERSRKIFLSVTKGMDYGRCERISEMMKRELGAHIHLAVLSGPTIAMEVARGIPSTAVVASANARIAKKIQEIFNSETFRIYTNSDVTGVELGGTVKNVIAVACGVCDGLGFGTNTKSAILTRGLAEMVRLGKALGAKTRTFSGLSGLGDLVTTCTNPQSRNRTVGEQLGKGRSIQRILADMVMVAEGVETVKAIHKLSRKLKAPMPITAEVYNIIYKNKKPSRAVEDLMRRKTKSE